MATPLFTELYRVAAAPYAVSLKPLLDTLQLHSPPITTHNLTLWSTSYPCLLPRLSSALLLSLEYCPFASQVLESLAKSLPIRDAVLKSKRTFLDGILKSALSSDRHFTRYSPIILSLLSHPLPHSTLPPPASLSTFFIRLVQTATLAPSPQSIKNIYTLLRATISTPMRPFLSRENFAMLVSQLQKFLRNEKQGCVLGALAALAVFHTQGGEGEGSEGWEGASELFGEKKSERVLSLVCLNVISAVGSGTGGGGMGKETDRDKGGEEGIGWEERLEQVEYAKVIVDAVGVESRWRYLEGEGRKGRVLENLVGKLRKLVGEGDVGTAENGQKEREKEVGVKKRLVRAAVEFLVNLVVSRGEMEGNSKGITTMAGLVEFAEGMVGRGLDCWHEEGWLIAGKSLGVLFAAYPISPHLPTLLKSCFNATTSLLPPCPSSFITLQELTSLVTSLAAKIRTSSLLCKSILSTLCTSEFSLLIESFLNYTPPIPSPKLDCANPPSRTTITSCPFALVTHQRHLSTSLCTLILTCTIYSLSEPHLLPPRTTTALLTFSITLTHLPQCPTELTTPTLPPTTLSLLETSATPGTTLTSHDWRTKLTADLSRDAARTHYTIISALGSICRDLESRCTNTEAPLHEAQARAEGLAQELGESKSREKGLAEAVSKVRAELGEVEHEKEGLEAQLDIAFEKVSEVEGELGRVRQEVDEERRLRSEDVLRARKEREKVEEECFGELAERGARIEELAGRVKELEEELEGMRGQLEKEKMEGNKLAADLDERGREVDERQRELVEKERELSEAELSVEMLTREVEEKHAVIKDLNEKLAQLENSVQLVLNQRDQALREKNAELARLTIANRELSMEAESREQDIQGLEEQVSALTTTIDSLGAEREKHLLEITHITESKFTDLAALEEARKEEVTALESEKKVLIQEIEKLRLDWASEVLKLRSRHEKEVLEGREELQRGREEWGVEREKLLGRVRAWKRKCGEWKEVVRRREREFEEVRGLAGRLMGMTGVRTFETKGVLGRDGREREREESLSPSSSQESGREPSPEMGLESTSTKGSGCGGVVTGNEKKVSRQLSSKRKSIIQVPFSGRPSISTTSRRRKSTEMLAIAGEEDSDNNDGSDDQGDIIPESSESFLQQELRPRKKARKSIVMNTNTLGMKLGGKRAEPQVGGKKPQQVQMVKSSPVLKQQHRVKQKQKQKQRHKGWSTSIYSREGRGHGYGKENHASKQGMDGSEEQVVGGSRTTVEDNACREGHPDGCGSDGHVDGGGSDEETEYAFGESVEFSSTPKVGIMVGC